LRGRPGGDCPHERGAAVPLHGTWVVPPPAPRDSGVGREGGNFSREFFTEPKAVVMQIDRA